MAERELDSMMQLVASMKAATKEIEESVNKKDVERFKKARAELLKFQKDIDQLLEKQEF